MPLNENKGYKSTMLDKAEQLVFQAGNELVCGVDEVGRGPLAGPVVAAAVILDRNADLPGLDDSKKLSAARREALFEQIVELGVPCAIGIICNETIDRMNIHKASLRAMQKAVMDLKVSPDVILVDGVHLIPNLSLPQYAIVKGDQRCKCISAASIVAKVTRDRIMEKYQAIYPSFSFATHKGYPTPDHLKELQAAGPCEIHRRSFKPVASVIEQFSLF